MGRLWSLASTQQQSAVQLGAKLPTCLCPLAVLLSAVTISASRCYRPAVVWCRCRYAVKRLQHHYVRLLPTGHNKRRCQKCQQIVPKRDVRGLLLKCHRKRLEIDWSTPQAILYQEASLQKVRRCSWQLAPYRRQWRPARLRLRLAMSFLSSELMYQPRLARLSRPPSSPVAVRPCFEPVRNGSGSRLVDTLSEAKLFRTLDCMSESFRGSIGASMTWMRSFSQLHRLERSSLKTTNSAEACFGVRRRMSLSG